MPSLNLLVGGVPCVGGPAELCLDPGAHSLGPFSLTFVHGDVVAWGVVDGVEDATDQIHAVKPDGTPGDLADLGDLLLDRSLRAMGCVPVAGP